MSLVEDGMGMLWDLTQNVCSQENILEECRDIVFVIIYKGKCVNQSCINCRGGRLISYTVKIWERIMDRAIKGKHI